VLASGFYQLWRSAGVESPVAPCPTALATVISFGVGYLVIVALLRLVSAHSDLPFVFYRIALGVAVLYLNADRRTRSAVTRRGSSHAIRWTFDQDKAAQLIAIRSLLDEIAFAFEDREAVRQAGEMFEQGIGGFSDCLIAAKHARNGCDFTATFDRGMRKLPGVKLL
jgi:predicted nucleic acid-binding protein